MTVRLEGLAAIGILIVLSFLFQIQLKLVANEIAPVLQRGDIGWGGKLTDVAAHLLSWRILFAGTLAAALLLVWLLALTKLELSLALPVASLALVVNAVGSGLLLGESLSGMRLAGIAVVAIGLVLVMRS